MESTSIFVYISKLERENKKLKKNWTNLKEDLHKDYYKFKDNNNSLSVVAYHSLDILNKMNEIEKS